MNIAVVTSLYPPIQTGSSYWAQELALNLKNRGHNVIVITCAPRGIETSDSDEFPVYRLQPLVRFPNLPIFFGFDQFYMMTSPRNIRRMKEILREHKIELLHQVGHYLDSIVLSRLCSRALDIPSVCSIHTRIGHNTNRTYDMIMNMVDRTVNRRAFLSGFNALVSMDEPLRSYARKTYKREANIIPVCINHTILEEQVATPGSDEEEFHLVSIGHVTLARNRLTLISAVSELLSEGHKIRMTVAGRLLNPQPMKEVKRLGLGESIRFLGEVPRQELYALLRTAHAEAHWIDIPGIGTAGMEAMALGLPIITYAQNELYGDVPLKDQENLLLVDPDSVKSVKAALLQLIESPVRRAEIGRKAREVVEQHLTWDKSLDKLEGVYRGCLQ